MSKILVTGAYGFVGSRLCPKLEELGHKVDKVRHDRCDLRNLSSITYNYTDEGQYDKIYHLACDTRAGDWCLTHAGNQWLNNQLINTNVLEFWTKYNPTAELIAIGTSCSYDQNLYTNEANYLSGEPHCTLYTYAMTKRMLYIGLKSISSQYNQKFMYLIPPTLYGPGFTDKDHHFVFDLIRKFHHAKLTNTSAEVWGDGLQQRQLLYIDDFIDELITTKSTNTIKNIGNNENISLINFSETLAKVIGLPIDKIYYNCKAFMGMKTNAIVSSLDRYYTPLDYGLKETYKYYLETLK